MPHGESIIGRNEWAWDGESRGKRPRCASRQAAPSAALHIHTKTIGRVTAAKGNGQGGPNCISILGFQAHSLYPLLFYSSTDGLLPVGSWPEFPSGLCFVQASYFLTAPLKLHWWWPLTSGDGNQHPFPSTPLLQLLISIWAALLISLELSKDSLILFILATFLSGLSMKGRTWSHVCDMIIVLGKRLKT